MLGDRIPIASHDADDVELCGVSFASRLQSPWGIYRFALILALLALPAVTSVTLSESNYSAHRPSWNRTLIRWTFLGAKFVLIASIAYFASLDLSYWHASTYSPFAEFSQLLWCFAICLFGGTLGVMYSIPLRRELVTQSDLPYPEGVACAEVLKVGSGEHGSGVEESRAGLSALLWGSVVSGAFSLITAVGLMSGVCWDPHASAVVSLGAPSGLPPVTFPLTVSELWDIVTDRRRTP